MKKVFAAAIAASALAAPSAHAILVNWADLTGTSNNETIVTGTITVGGTNVGVTYSGATGFVQTNGGTNYWTEPEPAFRPYTGGIVDNAPPTPDIIALNAGGLKTITFSQAVTDPFLALVSWNGNAGTFTQPFDVISEGCGFWGCGSFTGVTPTTFTGSGELHGVIRFQGTFTQVSFTDLNENWHGIQIGIAGIAPPAVTVPPPTRNGVPEPSVAGLLLGALGLLGLSRRRQRR